MKGPRIDKGTVERMLLAYIRDPNPTYVARECAVAWVTAKKYITEGAPDLGIAPFATEARRLLRAQDKLVRLTEVTKEIRVQVEAKDLGAYQDLLFQFEGIIQEVMGLVRARTARELKYYDAMDAHEAWKPTSPEDVPPDEPKAFRANTNDLRNLSVAMRNLLEFKREFWDRLEIIRRTEVEVGGREGLVGAGDQVTDDPGFDAWEPHEIAAYVEAVEAGREPIYPSWYGAETQVKQLPAMNDQPESAKSSPDSDPTSGLSPTPTNPIAFPGE